MSVRAYNERRKQYRKTARQVSNPGQPSPTNRAARRAGKHLAQHIAEEAPAMLHDHLTTLVEVNGYDPRD